MHTPCCYCSKSITHVMICVLYLSAHPLLLLLKECHPCGDLCSISAHPLLLLLKECHPCGDLCSISAHPLLLLLKECHPCGDLCSISAHPLLLLLKECHPCGDLCSIPCKCPPLAITASTAAATALNFFFALR